jgi:hypothetical protein
MKTILLPFHDEDAGRTALDAATLVARRFGSYLEGLLVVEGPHLTPFDRRMPCQGIPVADGQQRRVADRRAISC